MNKFLDFLWPTLDSLTPEEIEHDKEIEGSDIDEAKTGLWERRSELALAVC